MRISLTILLLLITARLSAQQSSGIALVGSVSSDESIGVLVHLSNLIAVRPTIGLSIDFRDETQDKGAKRSEETTTGILPGLDVLLYLDNRVGSVGELSLYGGLGGEIAIQSKHSQRTELDTINATIDTLSDYNETYAPFTVSAFFGVQYAVSRRLSMFGEIGGRYTWASFDYDDEVSRFSLFRLVSSSIGILYYISL